MMKKSVIFEVLWIIGVILLVLYALFPYMWTFITSIKPEEDIFSSKIEYIPKRVTIENYKLLLIRTSFSKYFRNSLIVATFTVFLSLFMAILAGYSFSRYRFPFKNFLMLFFILTTMVPKILLVIPLFAIFRIFKLVDTHIGLIIAYTTFTLPFSIWMLKGFFDGIPVELEEAAMIDGCGRLKAFFYVSFPISVPGVAATGIYIFINSWNEFLYALMFTSSDEVRTLPVGLQSFVGQYQINWGLLTAGGILTSIPLVILFIFIQKYLVKGLAAGAVKG